MTIEKKCKAAILSVFPSPETFQEFCKDSNNQKTIDSFIDLAMETRLIRKKTREDFLLLIRKHSGEYQKPLPSDDLTLEELFREKKDLLQLSISTRALTGHVNNLIKKHGIVLPKLTSTMLTRLKKEPANTAHKRNSLRAFCFWIGYERPDLEISFDYETLLKLCNLSASPLAKIDHGVRIGLRFYSRGDVIDQDSLAWLRKNIKHFIKHSINTPSYGNWGTVKLYDITTLYVDFPKEGKTNYPTSYQACIRKAIALAHRIANQWALSKFYTKNRFLSIGIASGEFANMNNYLLPILNARLPGDPVIRMTDYTHQCILISDIRTVFCKQPVEKILFNDEPLYIWWIVGIWNFIYWDFIPELLEDELLQATPDAISKLNQQFMNPEQMDTSITSNAIKHFFLFPHNALLGVEIAKTLYFRKRLGEANEILRIVLSLDPLNISARALRMMVYNNLGIEEPELSLSRTFFQRAEEEAQFVLETSTNLGEDFYCEYGLVKMSKAISILRRMRNQKDANEPLLPDNQKLKSKILEDIQSAKHYFQKGMVVSPTGYRAIYFSISAETLLIILQTRDAFFETPAIHINAPKQVYKKRILEIMSAFNYYRWGPKTKHAYPFLEKALKQSFDYHTGAGTLRTYLCNLYFCFAVMLWDVYPNRTVSAVKMVLNFFEKTISMAQTLEEQNLYIGSYTCCASELLKPAEFIRHIKTARQKVEAFAGKMEILEQMEPSQEIKNDEKDFTLLTLNI